MKNILCILAILSIYYIANAQSPAIQWQINYGSFYEDNGSAIKQLSDGSYMILGSVTQNNGDVSGNHGGRDFWLVKLNPSGDIIWQKCYGGSGNDYGIDIQITSDGGFILLGHTMSNDGDVSGNHPEPLFGNFFNDIWVVKVDNMGDIQWQKCLGGTKNEYGTSIKQTLDGGYILTGYTTSNDGDVSGNHGNGDVWVVKLDSGGNIQWQKCLGGTITDYGYSITQTIDGGYILIGYTISNDGDVSGNHGAEDTWVVKLDNTGNIQWQKCYGGTKEDRGYSIIQTSDGGFIFTGSSVSNNGDLTNNKGGYDVWVVKINNIGNIVWQKNYGGKYSENGYSIIQTNEGGFAISGSTFSNDGDVSGKHPGFTLGVGEFDYWVLKISNNGNFEWQKCLGGDNDDFGASIIQTLDGGFAMIGQTVSENGDVTNNNGYSDIWVVKLEAYTVNTVDYQLNRKDIALYPNPVQNMLYIQNAPHDVYARIYNIQGSCVMQTIGNAIDISILPSGLYALIAGGQTKRFVKE